jgi:ectoine hydroxylase-related dioxygenase (phytanoyl-CoA dioxygenase family)
VVGYIDDVEPGGGGFTVWPGSHAKFYQDFTTRYTFNPTAEYALDREAYNCQQPAECHGQAGDVVFWHHRIGHSAGHNRSGRIRQAVLADFKKHDLAARQDLPPGDDMWVDWAV